MIFPKGVDERLIFFGSLVIMLIKDDFPIRSTIKAILSKSLWDILIHRSYRKTNSPAVWVHHVQKGVKCKFRLNV
jgi:hypothetical protein